jgi:hypothetical protein
VALIKMRLIEKKLSDWQRYVANRTPHTTVGGYNYIFKLSLIFALLLGGQWGVGLI